MSENQSILSDDEFAEAFTLIQLWRKKALDEGFAGDQELVVLDNKSLTLDSIVQEVLQRTAAGMALAKGFNLIRNLVLEVEGNKMAGWETDLAPTHPEIHKSKVTGQPHEYRPNWTPSGTFCACELGGPDDGCTT
jgi:hypothetical protein